MSKIVIGQSAGKQLKLDINLLITSRLLIQANSGGGKSWLLRRLAEQCWGKVQTIIIDPEGEFFTLREKFGYVLVGEGGETPADVRSAALLAEKFLQLKASAVCDLYEAFRGRPMEQRQWVRAFLEALLGVPRTLWHPVLVIVDEAHKFCPQETPKAGNQRDREIISECKNAMISLSTTGRKRGFCAIWATQRLAKVDKDASAEMFNRMVGMTIEDVDVDRAADLMSVSKEEKRDFRNSLRTLNPGDFYAFGRAITTERTLVKVGDVQTRHPETGTAAKNAEPPPMPEQVKALLPQLADLPKAAEEKAWTEAAFKREIRELKQKLTAAEKAKPAVAVMPGKVDPRQIERAVAVAVRPLREQLRQIKTHASRAARSLPIVLGALEDIEKSVAEVPQVVVSPVATPRLETPPVRIAHRPAASVPVNGDGTLGNVEQNILNQLAELETLGIAKPEKAQLALMAGYTNARSGGFTEPLARLVQAGWVVYPSQGFVALTEAGRAKATTQEQPLTRRELHDRLGQKLGGPAGNILREIISAYPESLAKEELAAKLNYGNPRSGGFTEPLGRLRALGIAEYPAPGMVKAADWLFIEGVA